jgi:hypothetical protein
VGIHFGQDDSAMANEKDKKKVLFTVAMRPLNIKTELKDQQGWGVKTAPSALNS